MQESFPLKTFSPGMQSRCIFTLIFVYICVFIPSFATCHRTRQKIKHLNPIWITLEHCYLSEKKAHK